MVNRFFISEFWYKIVGPKRRKFTHLVVYELAAGSLIVKEYSGVENIVYLVVCYNSDG